MRRVNVRNTTQQPGRQETGALSQRRYLPAGAVRNRALFVSPPLSENRFRKPTIEPVSVVRFTVGYLSLLQDAFQIRMISVAMPGITSVEFV